MRRASNGFLDQNGSTPRGGRQSPSARNQTTHPSGVSPSLGTEPASTRLEGSKSDPRRTKASILFWSSLFESHPAFARPRAQSAGRASERASQPDARPDLVDVPKRASEIAAPKKSLDLRERRGERCQSRSASLVKLGGAGGGGEEDLTHHRFATPVLPFLTPRLTPLPRSHIQTTLPSSHFCNPISRL